MALSLKKCLMKALEYFGCFMFIVLICLVMGVAGSSDMGLTCLVSITVASVFMLLPALYYFSYYLVFKKKYKDFTPVEGVVFNWEAGLFRGAGAIIVKVDDKKYSTLSYFNNEECNELVGKTISYAIIDDILFVYDIKE